ncbi:MAG: VCBS repeat-containing protein, partial [Candidatus Obscuribacterales bacterium]|nr:VCBS repeat-containing protein [Steroidobacteraceae bacterium]
MQNPASPGNFLAPTTIAIGNRSTAVATGDVDGDGTTDIAVANQDSGGNTGRVSVFLNAAGNTGVFTRVDAVAGTEPIAVKIGDVDGDGLADLIVANEGPGLYGMGTSGVSVLLQTVAGTFLAPVTYATARGTVSVAVGDVNSDSLPDLVTANRGGSSTGTISVLLQDATRPGVFFSAVNYAGICEPLSVALGDLNQDGRIDIAVADGDRATVMFQSTITAGTFAAPVKVGQ